MGQENLNRFAINRVLFPQIGVPSTKEISCFLEIDLFENRNFSNFHQIENIRIGACVID